MFYTPPCDFRYRSHRNIASHSYLGLALHQEGFPGGALGGGPGGLPAGGPGLLEAGLQPGAQQVAGEAGRAGGELGVRGGLEGDGPGLGRPDIYSLGAGGITYVTACSVSEMDTRGWETTRSRSSRSWRPSS